MKIFVGIVVSLLVTFNLFAPAKAADSVKECYQCSGKCDKTTKEKCEVKATTAAGTTAGSGAPSEAPTTAAPLRERRAENESARLREKRDANETEAPKNTVIFKCLTIKYKDKVNNTDTTWKGCGLNCKDDLPEGAKESDCTSCEKDLCNLSVRIKSIGWIPTLIAMLCLGLSH